MIPTRFGDTPWFKETALATAGFGACGRALCFSYAFRVVGRTRRRSGAEAAEGATGLKAVSDAASGGTIVRFPPDADDDTLLIESHVRSSGSFTNSRTWRAAIT